MNAMCAARASTTRRRARERPLRRGRRPAHKLRAFLTVLGIVVGVATVIAMVSIVEGFNNNVVASFQSFGATLVQFQKFEPRFGPGDRDESESASARTSPTRTRSR